MLQEMAISVLNEIKDLPQELTFLMRLNTFKGPLITRHQMLPSGAQGR
jgi:hypothetical protein